MKLRRIQQKIAILSLSVIVGVLTLGADPAPLKFEMAEATFDRLDGKGPSGKRVDVIEWENNLELHVYPAGSLAGLALTLDPNLKDKKVMVIGYRFQNQPKKQLIRRAILGIPIGAGFRAYRDPSVTEYDKIIISNQGLAGNIQPMTLDPTPSRLYPDGHPAIAGTAELSPPTHTALDRLPASDSPAVIPPPPAPPTAVPGTVDHETGAIRPFRW